MYTYCGPTEQMRACVSRYDESAWASNDEARIDAHIASTGLFAIKRSVNSNIRCFQHQASVPINLFMRREWRDASMMFRKMCSNVVEF